MATTIINPQPTSTSDSSGNGLGFLIGVILLVLFFVMLFFYGLPYLTRQVGTTSPQVNVPDHVNVNVQHQK